MRAKRTIQIAEPMSLALSVVIPVYGCSETLRELQDRLSGALRPLGVSYEIIYVDDRCKDGSWRGLRAIAADDPHVTAVRLSRNFGQHLAITAGLSLSRGRRVVVMDCDLQDPPELIPTLLAEAEKGYEIVYARRKSKFDSWWRQAANRLYFKALNKLARQRLEGEFGTLSIISRKVVDSLLDFHERDRHYLMMLRWMGFKSTIIDFERDRRRAGESSYDFRRLLSHAFAGVVFSTTRLLNYVVRLGFVMAGIGLLMAFGYIVRYFWIGASPGWTSLVVSQLVIGGITITCVGIAALYIGKIFQAVQQRPLFIVEEMIRDRRSSDDAQTTEPEVLAGAQSALAAPNR